MSPSPVWHPFTQHGLEPPMKRVVSADGAFLVDEDGNRLFDAISSWWVITHGHRHPAIMAAIRAATETLDQVIFAEFSHEPAETLARGLIELAPAGLNHVFYSDSGSTAVEVALKMALGYFHNCGEKRDRIVVMEHGYHGDTIGTMSTGERGVFNAAYEPLLFGVDRLAFPEVGSEQCTLDMFEAYCRSGRVAALLVEPLVLGAGGMKVYAANVLAGLKQIAESHGCLVIADEVMTGWGRTGTVFACEQAAISPDILCTSKGLTGGSLPLAATLCSAQIFDAHFRPTAARPFSIRVPIRPIRSPAPPPSPIFRSGGMNRFSSASGRCNRRSAIISGALPMMAVSPTSGRQAPLPRLISWCRRVAIFPRPVHACASCSAGAAFSSARSATCFT